MTEIPTVTVSYSELKDAMRCAYKHRLGYIESYQIQERHPMSALRFGNAWHDVLEEYYRVLQEQHSGWTEGTESPYRAAKKLIYESFEEVQQEPLLWMLEGYSAHYGTEPGWTILGTEEKLVVDLPQLMPDLRIKLKVKIDLIIMDRLGQIWVDDHKSAYPLPKAAKVDYQLPLYIFALRQMGKEVFGARYSYTLKPPKVKRDYDLDKRFARYLENFTEAEVANAAKAMYRVAYTTYKNQELWGHDQPKTVQDDCRFCDFEKPCKASRKGRDPKPFLADIGAVPWRENLKAPQMEEDEREF